MKTILKSKVNLVCSKIKVIRHNWNRKENRSWGDVSLGKQAGQDSHCVSNIISHSGGSKKPLLEF